MRATVGLSIRSNWVEVLEVQRGFKRKIQVTKFGRFPIASPERSKVIEAIKGAWEAANIKTKEVVLAIPTQEVILRYFTLPVIPKSEWAGAIQFEARKYVPFKLDELVWDFHVSERKGQRQLDVIFVAARKEIFLDYMSLLQEVGLKAVAVEAASFGLARALTFGNPALAQGTFTAIDVCGETAHVALIHHGVPQVARDVFLIGQSEFGSLEQLIRPAPAATPSPVAPPTSAAAAADEAIPVPPVTSEQEQQFAGLLSELRLSLDYFAREFPGQEVKQVVLCGEDVVGQWKEGLAQELKMTVELAHSHAIQGSSALPLAWTLALGLALHEAGVPGPRVNFVQHEAQTVPLFGRASIRVSVLRPVLAELVLACVALVALFGIQQSKVARAQQVLRQLQAARSQIVLPVPAPTTKELKALRQTLEGRLALLQATVGSTLYLTPKLAALPRVLPEPAWLENLTVESSVTSVPQPRVIATLRGRCLLGEKAREIALVNQVVEQLRQEPEFFGGFQSLQLATLGSERLKGNDMTSFELNASTDPRENR